MPSTLLSFTASVLIDETPTATRAGSISHTAKKKKKGLNADPDHGLGSRDSWTASTGVTTLRKNAGSNSGEEGDQRKTHILDLDFSAL